MTMLGFAGHRSLPQLLNSATADSERVTGHGCAPTKLDLQGQAVDQSGPQNTVYQPVFDKLPSLQ